MKTKSISLTSEPGNTIEFNYAPSYHMDGISYTMNVCLDSIKSIRSSLVFNRCVPLKEAAATVVWTKMSHLYY